MAESQRDRAECSSTVPIAGSPPCLCTLARAVAHCASVCSLCLCLSASWTEVNPRAFTPRASAVSAYFPDSGNGTWIVLNGLTHNATGEETVLYDAQKSTDVGMTWTPLPPTPFIRCEMAADVVQLSSQSPNLTLLVSGGVDFISYESFNDVWRTDDMGLSFQLVTAAAPWPIRHAHGMVTMARHFPQLLVILGGYRQEHAHSTEKQRASEQDAELHLTPAIFHCGLLQIR